METPPMAAVGPRKRDPERRRREILDAAVEIALEGGTSAITHRAVAARSGVALGSTTRYFASIDELREVTLRRLGEELDEGVDEIGAELAAADDVAERMIDLTHEFLGDDRRVRASVALMAAAVSDEALAPLARGWTDRLIVILTRHTDPDAAAAIDTYLNGATMHTALLGHPPDRATIARVVHALFTLADDPGAR